MRKVFITGITGTLGQAVSKILLEDGNNIVTGFSRDELKQSQIKNHPNLRLVLGDIRDKDRLVKVTKDQDLIFHFAALKRVDMLETNVEEVIKTNVIGTQNVFDAQLLNGIPKIVLSSTDKACYPINAYGSSKALAERIILQNKDNVVCRYGNVLASRGSAAQMFIESVKKNELINITDRFMTRFFIKIEDAARFVVNSASSTGINIPKMKSCKMIDFASAVYEYINGKKFDDENKQLYKITGVRPGEKIHECLSMRHEPLGEIHSNTSEYYTNAELLELIGSLKL